MLPERLDDILALKNDALRQEALEEFLSPYNHEDPSVILKTSDGKNGQFSHRGRIWNVHASNGVKVPRHIAVEMIEAFGKNGKYTGRDRATGMTRQKLRNMEPDQYANNGFVDPESLKFVDQYLTHDLRKPEAVEQGA